MGKRIYCFCHPTWLPCKTYIKHKTAAEHLTWMMYSSTLIVFSFCLWQPLPIFRDCLQVTWLKEPFEIMKVLDPWRLQGVHRLRLTTETTRCSPPKWNTNQCETPTTCHTNPGPAGRALTVRDLVARKDLPAWAPVTCRRGTRICRKELRSLCKRSKNRSLILCKGDLRTVRNRCDVKADSFALCFYQTSLFKGGRQCLTVNVAFINSDKNGQSFFVTPRHHVIGVKTSILSGDAAEIFSHALKTKVCHFYRKRSINQRIVHISFSTKLKILLSSF